MTAYDLLLLDFTLPLSFGALNLTASFDALSSSLTALLFLMLPLFLLIAFHAARSSSSVILLVLLVLLLLVAYTANDLLLFYLSFEASLLPLFLLILFDGAKTKKIYAALLLVLFTLLGSISFLIALLTLVSSSGSCSSSLLAYALLKDNLQALLIGLLLLTLLVKLPSFPFHLWLPQAHAEASTLGSMILAALVLKLAAYGLLRFLSLPYGSALPYYAAAIAVLSIASLFYASLLVLLQVDLKKLIAYSSIAHMALLLAVLLTNDANAYLGALMLCCSHAASSALLFFLIGFLYGRSHSRLLKYAAGYATYMPLALLFLFIGSLANLSLPGTGGFLAELLLLSSLMALCPEASFLLSASILLSGAYAM
ncbi:MAG: proton-conducting transporter membrane subunit [Cyanobacteria bacterium J06553_1]